MMKRGDGERRIAVKRIVSRLTDALNGNDNGDIEDILNQHQQILRQTDDIKFAYLRAISQDHVNVVKLFHKHNLGFNIKEYLIDEETPLSQALHFQCPKVLVYLISEIKEEINEHFWTDVESPLHIVVGNHTSSEGQVECLNELLKLKGLPKDSFKGPSTPLMVACFKGSVDCVKILLKAGCRPDLTNDLGCDSAHCCLNSFNRNPRRSAECLRVLIQNGYPIWNKRILQWTIESSNILALSLLADANIDINAAFQIPVSGHLGSTEQVPAVTFASRKHKVDVVTFLINAGCFHYHLVHVHEILACDLHNGDYSKCAFQGVIRDFLSAPRSLKDLCRIKIRHILGFFPRRKISQLGLPKKVAEYVSGDDFLRMTL